MIIQPIGTSTAQAPRTSGKVIAPLIPTTTPPNTSTKKKTPGQIIKIEEKTPLSEIQTSAKSVFDNIQNAIKKFSTTKPTEGLAAPIGRAMQKVPNLDLGTKGQKTFKSTDTETKIVNFISNFPSAIVQGLGKDLELLSTKEGKEKLKADAKNLPQTIAQVKAHIDNKEWQQALETATSNSAFTVGFDIASFLPVGAVGKIAKGALGKKAVDAGVRKEAQQIVKEAIKETEEKVVKNVDNAIKPPTEAKTPQPVIKTGVKPQEPVVAEAGLYDTGIPTVKVSEFGNAELEKPVVNAIRTFYDEGTVSSGFHSSLNNKWTIVFDKTPTSRTIDAAKKAGFEVNTRINTAGQKLTDISLPKEFGIKDVDKATSKFNEWVKNYDDSFLKNSRVAQQSIGGVKTPSKIGLSIETKAIEAKLTKGFEGVAGYDKITIKEQAAKAAQAMTNLDEARAIIRGEKPLPSGLRGTSLITAAEEQIAKTGDSKLAYELANSPLVSETSAAAQELRLAAERQPDSLALKLRQLKQAKEENFKRRYANKDVKKLTEDTVSDIKKKIKVPDKYDWNRFVQSLPTC